MFWQLTPFELAEVFKRKAAKEKDATLRAALIAATIVNVHRRKGAPLIEPGDFIREAPREEDFMDVEEAILAMDRWAAEQNAAHTPKEN